jgi:hypothetical protein
MLCVEAFSAEWDVSFLPSNKLNLFIQASSEGEVSVLIANLADSCEFLNFFCFGDQVNNVLEASSEECAIKCRYDNDLTLVGESLCILNHLLSRVS